MNAKAIVIALVLCAALVNAAVGKIEVGPRGGRILEKTSPKAEFFIEKDRTVSIRFYDIDGKAMVPSGQSAMVIAESGGSKQRVEFEKQGDALVSKSPLPPGDANNLVLQFRQSPDAKPQNYRFKADLSFCGGCKRAEYACTCHE